MSSPNSSQSDYREWIIGLGRMTYLIFAYCSHWIELLALICIQVDQVKPGSNESS